MSYITATYLLEMVSNITLILNDPKSIRDNPEKLSMFNFKNIIPPTLISKNIEQCFNFQKKYKKTIIKPLYGNGGEGISKLEGTRVGGIIFLKLNIDNFSGLSLIDLGSFRIRVLLETISRR